MSDITQNNEPKAAPQSAKVASSVNANADASSLNVQPVAKPSGMVSTLPEFEDPEDNEFVDSRNIGKTKKAQLQRIFGDTWVRLVLIAAAIVGLLLSFILVKSIFSEQLFFGAGGITSTLEVDKRATGRENLNKTQAEYLMERQRQNAREKAKSGESTAAVLELPRASVDEVNNVQNSQFDSFDTNHVRNQYAIDRAEEKRIAERLANQNVESLDLTNNERYEQIGNYYIDKDTNKIVMPPSQPTNNHVAKAQNNTSQMNSNAQQNPNATYVTNQQGGGQNYNQGGGQNNGGQNPNQGGGQNNGGQNVDPNYQNPQQNQNQQAQQQQQAQPRQPDPDLPIIQKRLYDNYESQLQEQTQWQQTLEKQRQQNLQQAQQIEQKRRQMALSSLNNQINTVQRTINNSGSGYSSQTYFSNPGNNRQQNHQQSNQQNNGQQYNNSKDSTNQQEPAQSNSGRYVQSSYNAAVDDFSSYSYNRNNQQNSTLPNNVIRAGTSWPLVVTKNVNTDEGLLVIGEIMDGPFIGSEVYGTVQPTGRDIGVVFTRILPPDPRKPIIPVNAVALSLGDQNQAVSTDKTNHYVQNYSVMALESAIAGYGDAYANQNETTIQQSDGTVITSKGETTRKEVTGNILSQFADRLNSDVAKLGNRAPTYYIKQGSVLTMKLATNMDINATSEDLASFRGGRSTL